jgi:hypothetical protein
MEERRKCTPDSCMYHALTDSVIQDLKEAMRSLADGQMQMRETIIKLTEAFKSMERLDKRIDSVDERIKGNEKDVSDLRVAVYKAGAVVAALMIILQIGLKIFVGV